MAFERQPSLSVVYNMPTTINYVVQPQQPLSATKSPHPEITMFAIPVLLTLIDLKCQCKSNSPFVTDPTATWLAISCFAAYCLAHGLELRLASGRPGSGLTLIRRGSALLGALCAASLASILSPTMTPVFFGLVSVGEIAKSYKIVWKWIDERIVRSVFREGQVERIDLPV